MTLFEIRQTGPFMNRLLTTDLFDSFLLEKAVIRSAINYTLEGRLNKDFYTAEEWENPDLRPCDFITWKEAKGILYQLIRGKKVPLSFQFTLHLMPQYNEGVLKTGDTSLTPDQIGAFVLNCRYEQGKVTLITAVTLKTFLPDKSAEPLWDKTMRQFLNRKEIPFEEAI